MFHGVPIVGVPFMLEQLSNSQRCAARGFGVVSPEAPAVRAAGVRYSRAGVAALVRKVSGRGRGRGAVAGAPLSGLSRSRQHVQAGRVTSITQPTPTPPRQPRRRSCRPLTRPPPAGSAR
jgi:hypothetical protein